MSKTKSSLNRESYAQLVSLALAEDLGTGDLTSRSLLDESQLGTARFLAKEPLVVCGQEIVREVLVSVDPQVRYEETVPDGASISDGTYFGTVTGPFRSILIAERTALNFLQRLSGIATQTKRIVDAVRDFPVRVLDTRKTTPGWRQLEKYAVRTGGGTNHRMGLYDAVLIKNNHIDALKGDVAGAVKRCRASVRAGIEIGVEVRNRKELVRALKAQPDVLLLDNMTPDVLRSEVEFIRSEDPERKLQIEASGGITEANVVDFAATGVDRISLGILTHSVRAADISLRHLAPS